MRNTPHNEKDLRVLLIGAILIFMVGLYFFVKAFYADQKRGETASNLEVGEPEDTAPTISPDTVRKKLLNQEKITFLDIRGEEAYAVEHIPDSILLSPEGLATYTPASPSLLVVVYSRTDPSSYEIAKNILAERDMNAFFLEGGFENWKFTNSQTISSGDPNSFIDQSKVVYISTSELVGLLKQGSTDFSLIDVQSKTNYEKVHIKGALNIPLSELEKRRSDIPSNTLLIVYGENELISFQAGVRLADLNVFAARTLAGNKNLIPESGLPLESEAK